MNALNHETDRINELNEIEGINELNDASELHERNALSEANQTGQIDWSDESEMVEIKVEIHLDQSYEALLNHLPTALCWRGVY